MFPTLLDVGLVQCSDNQSQRLVRPLALPHPLLGYLNFFLAPFLVFQTLLPMTWNPLLVFLYLQWYVSVYIWKVTVWVLSRTIFWLKGSPCLTWESSSNSAWQFSLQCLNPWTCIRLVDYLCYQGRYLPWFEEIDCCVVSPPRAPDSIVLSEDIDAYFSLEYRLIWWFRADIIWCFSFRREEIYNLNWIDHHVGCHKLWHPL